MKKISLNSIVKMYDTPAIGNIDNSDPVMALAVDPTSTKSNTWYGLVRKIISRSKGEVVHGNTDKSILMHVVSHDSGLTWGYQKELYIKGINKIIAKLNPDNNIFLGLEDPDIIFDEKEKLYHVYFTIPFKGKGVDIYLGHAKGKSLTSLRATNPVHKIMPGHSGFKEVAIAPVNRAGYRLNLAEGGIRNGSRGHYSFIGVLKAKKFDAPWEYLDSAFHPSGPGPAWCNEHASPVRFFQKKIVPAPANHVFGLMNGRERSTFDKNNHKIYEKFRPGLFLYNYEKGFINWIDDVPLIEDPLAKAITFASEYVHQNTTTGLIYAHPNDAFVRIYEINYPALNKYLKKKLSKSIWHLK